LVEQNPSRIDETVRIIVENVDDEGEIAFIMASVYTEDCTLRYKDFDESVTIRLSGV